MPCAGRLRESREAAVWYVACRRCASHKPGDGWPFPKRFYTPTGPPASPLQAGGWVEDERVCGMLAVTRAFGDPEFKGEGLQKLLRRGVEEGFWTQEEADQRCWGTGVGRVPEARVLAGCGFSSSSVPHRPGIPLQPAPRCQTSSPPVPPTRRTPTGTSAQTP